MLNLMPWLNDTKKRLGMGWMRKKLYILHVEGTWITVTRGQVRMFAQVATIVLPCCTHAPLWYDFAALPINRQMVFTCFLYTAYILYLVTCFDQEVTIWLFRLCFNSPCSCFSCPLGTLLAREQAQATSLEDETQQGKEIVQTQR